MKTLTLSKVVSDEDAAKFGGEFADDSWYDHLIDEPVDVYTDKGEPLIKLRRSCFSDTVAVAALRNLYHAATNYGNRGMAAGKIPVDNSDGSKAASPTRFKRFKRDGTISKTNIAVQVPSGIIGAFDRNPRYPYCRLTKFTVDHFREQQAAMPFIQAVDHVFAENEPKRYAVQKAMCQKTHPDYVMQGTAFTTITVNRNWRTACHTDAGDLKEGFGVLSVLREGSYNGGFLVFPQWRVAVNIRHRDVILCDVHQWHGNTEIVPQTRFYTRLSCVFYYRKNIVGCGSLEDELKRVQNRKIGQPIYDQRELEK